MIINRNFINSSSTSSSPEDNNENILNTSNSNLTNHNNDYNGSMKTLKIQKSIDTVDCPLVINAHTNHPPNHHYRPSFSSLNYQQDYEQCATNQQQFNNNNHQLLINSNGLSGSCSQLNNLSVSHQNKMTNHHSVSLSNLTNLSNSKSFPQQQQQCNCCLENENRNWIPKFNSFGNDALEPVEILPHLLLGSESHASQLDMLKRIGVTALLNVSHSCPNHFEKDFIYKCIPVQDSSFEDISVYFDDAIQFIGKFFLDFLVNFKLFFFLQK